MSQLIELLSNGISSKQGIILIFIILLSFIFDYINGFHDAANSIATIVATKVLTPVQAVLWAALFNFAAYFISAFWIGKFKIGNTIAKSVSENFITLEVILAGIIAAIIWNLITWKFGIPSSSSHTLIGGFIGAAITHAGGIFINGQDVIIYKKVIPIIIFIVLSPMIGMVISSILTILINNICKKIKPSKAEIWFRKMQLLSSALFSLGHGGNDAQKVMGIIGAAVIFYNTNIINNQEFINADDAFSEFVKHYSWVPITSFIVIALGTISGGWKIIKTMGSKITKVTPLEGVSAETSGAITLYIAEHFGIPVSTTHTITGSIIGVGLTKRVSAVRWGVTISLIWAWILTIPISAIISSIIYYILKII